MDSAALIVLSLGLLKIPMSVRAQSLGSRTRIAPPAQAVGFQRHQRQATRKVVLGTRDPCLPTQEESANVLVFRDTRNKPVVLLEAPCVAFPGEEFKAIVPETVSLVQSYTGLRPIRR